MDIGAAIRELCKVHTLNDPETGFTVYQPLQRTDAYHEAWATLRRAVDLPTEPAEAEPYRRDTGETICGLKVVVDPAVPDDTVLICQDGSVAARIDLKKPVAGEKILR